MNEEILLNGQWKLESISQKILGRTWWRCEIKTCAQSFGTIKYHSRQLGTSSSSSPDQEINAEERLTLKNGTLNEEEKKKSCSWMNEMSVEFEVRLDDIEIIDEDDCRTSTISSSSDEKKIAPRPRLRRSSLCSRTVLFMMNCPLKTVRTIARSIVPKERLSKTFSYSGTFRTNKDSNEDANITFSKPLDDKDGVYYTTTGIVEHDITSCSDNFETLIRKEMLARRLEFKDDDRFVLVRKFHLSEDKDVLTLVTPECSCNMQLRWRRIK